MNTSVNISKILRIKFFVIALLTTSVMGAFATFGIYTAGKTNDKKPRRALLSPESSLKPGTFSLKSGYLFRGGQLFTTETPRYFNLNAVASYQVGNTTYVLPLKKKILMGKVSIIPFSENH
jgi:hypothetical protein